MPITALREGVFTQTGEPMFRRTMICNQYYNLDEENLNELLEIEQVRTLLENAEERGFVEPGGAGRACHSSSRSVRRRSR